MSINYKIVVSFMLIILLNGCAGGSSLVNATETTTSNESDEVEVIDNAK